MTVFVVQDIANNNKIVKCFSDIIVANNFIAETTNGDGTLIITPAHVENETN